MARLNDVEAIVAIPYRYGRSTYCDDLAAGRASPDQGGAETSQFYSPPERHTGVGQSGLKSATMFVSKCCGSTKMPHGYGR
jgi:hypothetical protein